MKELEEYLEKYPRLLNFVKDNKDMLIKVAAVAIVVVVAFFISVFKEQGTEPSVAGDSIEEIEQTEAVTEKIFVDIGGEVKNPMVAELSDGCRVEDAIDAAGGLTENADITDVNRAAFVEDGEKIFIPSLVVQDESKDGGESSVDYSDGKININTADSEELQELNGVGPATAKNIIDYRDENGRFGTIEDIKNVSGIGDKSFEKLKDDIKV